MARGSGAHRLAEDAAAARPAVLRGEEGQAAVLLTGLLVALLLGALVLGGIAQGLGVRSAQQRAADLAALAGGRVLLEGQDRLFAAGPRHLERRQLVREAEAVARETAQRNGVTVVRTRVRDDGGLAPMRLRVEVVDGLDVRGTAGVRDVVAAEAEIVPPDVTGLGAPGAGDYPGPFAIRHGKPMRPDVARAFDRMSAAAAEDGHALLVVSAWRSSTEQAALFAANPDPKMVAPPGRSLHRLGTELDLAPRSAYAWLAANAGRFGFVQRYSWEWWHWGYTRNAATSKLGGADGKATKTLQSFVPPQYAAVLRRTAQRWNVSAALLAAQLYQESRFNPMARSPAGAQGIAQFMPGTARAYGLRNPFDAEAAIDAQGHLMHDLLRQFGSPALALAAYNAGPGAVQRYGGIPPFAETRAYVATILGLLRGAGDLGGSAGEVRLVA